MGVPAYREIAEAIRTDIAERRLVEGDRLPTVRDLATRFDVPSGTVSKALDVLRMEGVIVSQHGRGLYVRSFSRITRSSPSRLAASHWGNGQAIQDHDTGTRPRVVHVEVGEVPVPADLTSTLGVPAGAAVLSRSRRFAVDDRIVQTATSYIPLDVAAAAPAVAYTGPGPGGIYARMADAGLKPDDFTERIICRTATPAEATMLDLPGGVPVISITREARTDTGRCVEVNVMLLDASAYELTYSFTAEG